MHISTRLLLAILLLSGINAAWGQTTHSYETFPTAFNTGFNKPINSSFQGDAGIWGAYSNNSYSTVVVKDAVYQSPPYALKLVNWKTYGCSGTSYCKATSPAISCSPTCATSASLSFKLYTYSVSQGNTHFTFYVEVSNNNGTTWTTLYSKTAQGLYNAFGQNTWNNISVVIPSSLYGSSFRYRFRGVQTAGCNANNYLYIDDVKIVSQPCANTGALSLGNQVWNDYDGDGKRDPKEPGIGNATISLYTDKDGDNVPDGPALRTTITDVYGRYLFTNLPAGRYITSIPVLPGFQPSPNTTTQATSPYPDNDVDNDNNAVNVVNGVIYTNAITLTAGGEPTNDGDGPNSNLTHDMAECGNSWIGDFVWDDVNRNGIQDAGEPGINGVTVRITFEDGTTATTTTTTYGHAGYYDFKNLGPGTYKITFTTPAAYAPTISDAGANDSLDSDPDSGDVIVTLAPNQSDFTIDAGFHINTAVLSLGNLVWNDTNLNGIVDATETGVANATVKLYKDDNNDNMADGDAIATTITNANGKYSFSGLEPGNYIVGVIIPVGNVRGPTASIDPDNDVDNDNNGAYLFGDNVAGSEVRSKAITLSVNTEPTADGDDSNGNLTLDIPLCDAPPPPPANLRLGNIVWNDCNDNGIRDWWENGVGGLSVKLYADADGDDEPDGAAVATTTTSAYGTYYFDSLPAGKYIVGVVLANGYTPGANGQTNPDNDINNDNNGVKLTGNEFRSNYITLDGREPTNDGDDANGNLTLDFGVRLSCSYHTGCHNNCTHSGCGHTYCGHNSCRNNCHHTGCGHPQCGHNYSRNGGAANAAITTATTAIAQVPVSVYPNPATSHFILNVNAPKAGMAIISITDGLGEVVLKRSVDVVAGANNIQFNDMIRLKSGICNLHIALNGKNYDAHIVVVK